MLLRWFLALLFLAMLPVASPSLAGEKIQPMAIRIELTSAAPSKQGKKSLDQAAAWKKTCSRLAKAFTVQQNFYKHGIAKKYSCYFEGKHTGGVNNKGDWTLKVQPDEKEWRLALFFRDQTEPEAEIKLPASPEMLTILSDPAVAKPLAMYLMDQLPVARYVEQKEISQALEYKQPKKKAKAPNAPPAYDLFELEYIASANMWVPRPLGSATLKKDKGSNRWEVKLTSQDKVPQGFWAQSVNGRGGEGDKYKSSLNDGLKKYNLDTNLLDSAKDALLKTLAGGYVGFRYGHPITVGQDIISKSAMIGILVEVRGGPLEGLRWYWDFAPETIQVLDGQKYSVTWSRPSLGWSFGLNINWIIDRIDLTPKLGLMDFDGTVPVPTTTGNVPAKFRLKNSSNIGFELGVETQAPGVLIRLWGASDASGVLDLGGTGRVTSLRGGVDTYWDAYKISSYFDLAVLVFMFGERLSLAKESDDAVGDTNLKLQGLSYNLAFFGAGLVLTW